MTKYRAFTLIELLVVVTILTILAIIGFAVFGNVSGSARDARRKADVDAIVKALENKFNAETGRYPDNLEASFFTSGIKPEKPEGEGASYDENLSWANSQHTGFRICVTLDNGTDQYCRESLQGRFTALASPSPSPSPDAKYVFITRNSFGGNLTASFVSLRDGSTKGPFSNGIAGADARCQDDADEGVYSGKLPRAGSYKAWITDGNINNSPAIRFTRSQSGYKLVNETVVADNWADLTDDSIQSPINLRLNGQSINSLVFTNTRTSGNINHLSDYHCQDWTSNSLSLISEGGRSSYGSIYWTSNIYSGCSYSSRLYCFEQ